jgi:hypothetical protein
MEVGAIMTTQMVTCDSWPGEPLDAIGKLGFLMIFGGHSPCKDWQMWIDHDWWFPNSAFYFINSKGYFKDFGRHRSGWKHGARAVSRGRLENGSM